MKSKLLIVDYSCHPFSLQLAKSFAKKNIKSMPGILKTYAVNKIKVSEVIEPEPLP